MKNAFELKPILVAAAVGAVLYLGLLRIAEFATSETDPTDTITDLAWGAVIGAGVQIGVRLTGVS